MVRPGKRLPSRYITMVSEVKIGFSAKRHVFENCWVANKDKLVPGGTGREEMARSLDEAHPDVSTVFTVLMQRLSEHERRAREFKEAVQIGLE